MRFASLWLLALELTRCAAAERSHWRCSSAALLESTSEQLLPSVVSLAPADGGDGDIEDWLASLQFRVPDGALAPLKTSFSIIFGAKVTVSVTVHELVCTGLRIGSRDQGGLTSSQTFRTVQLAVSPVALSCSATLAYDSSLGLSGNAAVKALTEEAHLGASLTLSSSDKPRAVQVPDGLQMGDCSADAKLRLQILSGSTWTELVKHLPALSSWLEGAVSAALSSYLCKNLLPSLEQKGSCALTSLAAEARQFLGPGHLRPVRWDDTLVRWQDQALMNWLSHFQDQFLSPHLPQSGSLCLVGDEARCLLPDAGKCILGPNADCLLSLPNLSNVTSVRIGLESLAVASTVANVTLAQPKNSTFRSSLQFENTSLAAAFDLLVGPTASSQDLLHSKVTVDLDIEVFSLSMLSLVGIATDAYGSVPSFHYFYPQCIAPLVKQLDIAELEALLRLGSLSLGLPPHQADPQTSPLLSSAVELVNNSVAVVTTYKAGLMAVLKGWAQSNATEWLNGQLASLLAQAKSEQCPAPMGEESKEGTRLIRPKVAHSFLVAGIALVAVACVLPALLLWPSVGGLYMRYRASLENTLCFSRSVPRSLALALPILVLACTAFLICSNFLLMAETFVALELRPADASVEHGFSLNVFQVMVYSLLFSIRKMLHEPTLRFLAWVLLVFSGVLPYAKLLLMFGSWIVPTKALSASRRGTILLVVDQIGKYSLIDVFVLQFISGGFYTMMRFTNPSSASDPEVDVPFLALRTMGEIGFFAFVMATVGSLVIGHVCLSCHQRDPRVRAERLGLPGAAARAAIRIPPSSTSRLSLQEVSLVLRGRRQRHLGPLLMLAFGIIFVGTTQVAFTVRLLSPVGQFAESSYSLLSFAWAMPKVSLRPNAFSTRFSQCTFFSFAILNIHVHMLLLLGVWFLRVKPSWLRTVNTLAQSLAAWSATDVAIISMVITLIELTTSHFVDLPDSVMAAIQKLSGEPLKVNTGLKVDVELERGTFILAVGVILHAFVGRAIMRLLTDAASAVQSGEQCSPEDAADDAVTFMPEGVTQAA